MGGNRGREKKCSDSWGREDGCRGGGREGYRGPLSKTMSSVCQMKNGNLQDNKTGQKKTTDVCHDPNTSIIMATCHHHWREALINQIWVL